LAVRAIARRCGIVVRPDGKRKLHKAPVALWGGVAVYLTLVLGLLAARWGSFGVGAEFNELSAVLMVAAGFVCACGAIDDCWSLHPRFKLALQVCAVLPIVGFGYSIDRIVAFSYPLELGWIGVPLTIAWLVGCINALNLVDGMDGLASLVGLLTAAMMGIVATNMGNDFVTVIAVVLAGSLAGFLVHNLPPATIFLGDSGSMVIGLVVGVLGIQGAMKTQATLAIAIPAVIMSLPMFDTLLAVVRRKLTGRRFDAADREHIHHRLLDRGLSQWQALCILGALCLATGAAATASTIFRNDSLALITALTLVVLAIRLRLFGNYELALVKSAIGRGIAHIARRLGIAVPEEMATGPGHSEEGARATAPGVASVSITSQLAAMPFEEAWTMLVERVSAARGCRLGLMLSSADEYLRHYGWADPNATSDQPSHWTVAVTASREAGEFCEIRAAGAEAIDADASRALTGLLRTFAAHFADRMEQVLGLVVVGSPPPAPSREPKPQRKAA
jgi:UDP-N-acetylmuramyl pentapeptide phosphotransferase/UDP-N-acetylglucosamine-1-phosphate transferase